MEPQRTIGVITRLILVGIVLQISLVHCFPAYESHPGNYQTQQSNGGSRCPGVACLPAPSGAHCEAKYGVQDKCCPRWVCTNGQTAYGSSSSNSQSWSNADASGTGYSYSSSFDTSQGQAFDNRGGQGQASTFGWQSGVPSGGSQASSYSTSFSSGNFGQGPFASGSSASGPFPGFFSGPIIQQPIIPLYAPIPVL